MAMIKYEDEKDLQRKICKRLNAFNYNFKKEVDSFFCDIVDYNIKAYGEVKTNGKFAPQQLLYGLAKENIQNAQYLILANEYELRVYKPPEFDKILKFAKRCSGDLSKSPSEITKKKLIDEGFNLLGTHYQIYTYFDKFEIDNKKACIFMDETNYEYIQMILIKYRINPADFIDKFAKTWSNKSRLIIKNDNQTIVDIETGNSVKAHRNIKNKFDRILIQSIRITQENIEKIIHRIDELTPYFLRRKRGKYWSSTNVSEIATDLIREYVKPDFIFEPFAGGGSLIRDLVDECDGIVNDIDGSAVNLLEQEWEGINDWKYYRKNIHITPLPEIYSWIPDLDKNKTFCIYTNPPFGTSSTNALASTKKEIKNMTRNETKSRKAKIQYGATEREAKYIGNTYGRGDLCLPSIAKMIEVIKHKGSGYLAFFSPFGVILGRKRYAKTLRVLLKDFEFIHGSVFDGDMFNGVAKKKSISFTIWKYHKNVNTNFQSLKFQYKDREYQLKYLPLLKDGWKYNACDDGDEIGTTRNDTFNNPNPKILKLYLHNSGSQMIHENVKIPLNLSNIPDPLVYGLWSITVGNRSLTNYPIIFDNCYTHLPDFENPKTIEVLSYSLLSVIISEITNNYTDGKIGFVGMRRIFKFGGKELTKGAQYLIDTYKDLPIGKDYTIGEVFQRLKDNEDPDDIDKKLRIMIKNEIQKRLNEIGYWDYLPIPRIN